MDASSDIPQDPEAAERVRSISRIVLRPIGSSIPLGFVAMAGATMLLTGLQLGWVPGSESRQVGILILAFAVPLQLLAAVFGYLARDSVGGTGMGALGGTWLGIGAVLVTQAPGARSQALGLFLCVVSVGLLVPVAAALSGKVLAGVVLGAAAVRCVLTGVFELTGSTGFERAAGWWGVGLTVVALYAALGFELEDTSRRAVLPVFRIGVARRAVEGGLDDGLDRVEREAGVREQL